ncbi:peptide methionine sulfoxide reductase [Leptobacterium flavescens]|uniref:peptide-methionine (S)-S-oxide reductase n=1 Tax=Leptobacterium flavescens TaxID=472055 RepID=A0A6P0UY91_9FLAO|nr:peptide-methionine (S)-S-oxide reductase [Leptobacterium flavescens]NER15416.1 peptide methionine sulfoxide reductase [Leptobacterium flavescens]
MGNTIKIGFGGGCHWCTEAVFLSLRGVEKVDQGWISSQAPDNTFSEAVIVHFRPSEIALEDLIAIHLHTHKSTADHSMRRKYRSAVYYFEEVQRNEVENILPQLQKDFDAPLVTQILVFSEFKASLEEHRNYYYKNPEKPFCETYINPKLSLLLNKFSNRVDKEKIPAGIA